MKPRLIYTIFFIVFLAIEVCIALFVHDSFIRPYIGDVLAVVTVYCATRILFPDKIRLMSLLVFAFAAIVELVQLTDLAEMFGEGSFIAILLGSTFDPADLLCYAVGTLFVLLWDIFGIKTLRNDKT